MKLLWTFQYRESFIERSFLGTSMRYRLSATIKSPFNLVQSDFVLSVFNLLFDNHNSFIFQLQTCLQTNNLCLYGMIDILCKLIIGFLAMSYQITYSLFYIFVGWDVNEKCFVSCFQLRNCIMTFKKHFVHFDWNLCQTHFHCCAWAFCFIFPFRVRCHKVKSWALVRN